MIYSGIWLPNCDVKVEDDDMIIFVDGVEIAREYDCGFNAHIVYDILEEHGYL